MSIYYISVIFSEVCFLVLLGGSCQQVRRGYEQVNRGRVFHSQ